jgi:pSer/pThr/pTyr-binding forkhead associated (FHA) protein
MIKCPFCKTNNVANTIFCDQCGYFLLDNAGEETDPLESNEPAWVGEPTSYARMSAPFKSDVKPLMVRLKVKAFGQEFEVPLERSIVLGRRDPTSSICPDVDLSTKADSARTISRRHARILKENERILVEDLGSVNGTYHNGLRLTPFVPELLKHGDRLQLGRLLIEVEIL